MSKVYHDKRLPAIEAQKRSYPDDFVEVAECATEDLGEIFELTNHIDQEWWLNPGVIKTIDVPVRSTSVGDIVVLSNGAAFVCRSMGWSMIGKVNDGPLPLVFQSGIGIFDVSYQNGVPSKEIDGDGRVTHSECWEYLESCGLTIRYAESGDAIAVRIHDFDDVEICRFTATASYPLILRQPDYSTKEVRSNADVQAFLGLNHE